LRTVYQQIDSGYLPGRFGGRVTLIRGRDETPATAVEESWWRTVAADVETIEVPGDRRTKLTRHVSTLGSVMDQLLDKAVSQSRAVPEPECLPSTRHQQDRAADAEVVIGYSPGAATRHADE
jgi:hypothetical protein